MASELETLIASLREADAKMTKGPWVSERATPHTGFTVWAGGMRLFLADHAPFDNANCAGAALLRNRARVVAKVIEELVAGLKQALADLGAIEDRTRFAHEPVMLFAGEAVANAATCLARVNQIITGAQDAR